MGIFSLFGCRSQYDLTVVETELINKINFKAEVISELKEITRNQLEQLPAIEQETAELLYDKFYNGLYSETNEELAIKTVKRLKKKFKENGYLIFVFENEIGKRSVAVIKGKDELDILRYRRTDGANYDLESEDIVKKISEWKSEYGLSVIGCSRDWLQIEFDKLPPDLDAFANEVYEFCPDIVDQGVGSVIELKEIIKNMNGVWLWWD